VSTDADLLAGSRAVLVGVSAYEYAEFPPIRAARNSLGAMSSLLSDPALCGWPPEWITVIANPISATGLATQIADLAEGTTGVLLLYYAGHGVLSASGELCLTVTSTRPDRPKISGLPWETLAEVLRGCPATVRLAILDCCFAGQATETLAGGSEPGLADIAHVEGVYTLAATTRNRAAHVLPPGQQDTACTSFTGELRDLIHSGIPGKAPRLTLTDLYPVLRQRLRDKGLPVPSQRGTGAAGQFYFSANAAVPTEPVQVSPAEPHDDRPVPRQENAGPVQPGQSRHTGLVADALRAVNSVTGEGIKAQALVMVAEAVAGTDPARAARLTDDAERLAQGIPNPAEKAAALAAVVHGLAAADPDRAERLARTITDPSCKAPALTAVATAVASTDTDRATRLSVGAERLAQSIPDPARKAAALEAIVQRLAAADPGRAERLARAIISPNLRALALATIADAVVATDPDRNARLTADAERLAQAIPGASLRAPALAAVARAMAATNRRRAGRLIRDAEHLAQAIPDPARKASALAAVVQGLAAIDAGHAERLAQVIVDPCFRARALAAAAKALATPKPHQLMP
jgi:caspase domain-containing protein